MIPWMLVLLAVAAPAGQDAAETNEPHSWRELAVAVLDRAEARIADHENPRSAVISLGWAAARLGPEEGMIRIRRYATLLREYDNRLPKANYVNAYAVLAGMVQSRDAAFRDDLLRQAIADADRALADDNLWIPPPGTRRRGNPVLLWRQDHDVLAVARKLWSVALQNRGSPSNARRAAEDIWQEARRLGYSASDARRPLSNHVQSLVALAAPEVVLESTANVDRPDWGPPDERRFAPPERTQWDALSAAQRAERARAIVAEGVDYRNAEELLALGEAAGLEPIEAIFASLKNEADRDVIAGQVAERLMHEGHWANAYEVFLKIESPERIINTAARLVAYNPR